MLNDDAFRTGIADTCMCECRQERETVEHVLQRCSKYISGRNAMTDSITEILNISNQRRSAQEKEKEN